jgi:hypothetical protein
MTAVLTTPTVFVCAAPADLAAARATARDAGVVTAVTHLHTEVCGATLPAGPGGHIFVPATVIDRCDRYGTPHGPRPRAGAGERWLADVPLGQDTMVALHVPGAGPSGTHRRPDRWSLGLGWYASASPTGFSPTPHTTCAAAGSRAP